jgi:tetratricopeptide (TPR) repeat protein
MGHLTFLEGDLARAQALLEEGLATLGEQGDSFHVGWILAHLGEVADARGDYQAAFDWLEKSLAIRLEREDQWGLAYSYHRLGRLAQHQEDWQTVRQRFAASLAISQRHENRRGIAECLEGLAAHAGSQGDPGRGVRLFGAASKLRETAGLPLTPSERDSVGQELASLHLALDEAAFAAAWQEGRAMPIEQAVAYALEQIGQEE